MKAKLFAGALTALLLAITLVQAGNGESINDKRETREVGPFTQLQLAVAADLYLTQGNEYSLVLEGDEDDLEEIETVVRHGTLKIKHDKPFHFGGIDRIKVYVTMKNIEGLSVSGSGSLKAETAVEAEDIELNVSGSGEINIDDLKATTAEMTISGSGDINLSGGRKLSSLNCDISGSGELHARDLETEKAELTISGSGGCKVYVTNDLEVDISGSGNVRYRGQPRIDANVSGSGDVEPY
jgi:hypothetical protein